MAISHLWDHGRMNIHDMVTPRSFGVSTRRLPGPRSSTKGFRRGSTGSGDNTWGAKPMLTMLTMMIIITIIIMTIIVYSWIVLIINILWIIHNHNSFLYIMDYQWWSSSPSYSWIIMIHELWIVNCDDDQNPSVPGSSHPQPSLEHQETGPTTRDFVKTITYLAINSPEFGWNMASYRSKLMWVNPTINYPHFYYGYIMIYANHQKYGWFIIMLDMIEQVRLQRNQRHWSIQLRGCWKCWPNFWSNKNTQKCWWNGSDTGAYSVLFFGVGLVSNLLKPKAIRHIHTYSPSIPMVKLHPSKWQRNQNGERHEQKQQQLSKWQGKWHILGREHYIRLQTVSSIKLRKEKQGASIICGCMVGNANPE